MRFITLLLFASLCLTATTATYADNSRNIYRFDSSLHDQYNLKPRKIQPLAAEQHHQLVARSDSPGFKLDFTCTAEPARCEKAETGFNQVFSSLVTIIQLKTELVVQAKFKSFCEPITPKNQAANGECTRRTTLGQAGASAFWYGTIERPGGSPLNDPLATKPYLFPQALVKQFTNDVKVQWNDFDIDAEFNTDIDFWFPGDEPIKPNQHDFTYVVLHELLHGLGFFSGWRSHFAPYLSGSLAAQFLVPPPTLEKMGSDMIMEGWEGLFVFDAFIVSADGLKTTTLADDITSENATGKLSSFVAGFLQSRQLIPAKKMWDLATTSSPSLVFQLSAATNNSTIKADLVLSTIANKYIPASSLSHVSATDYLTSPEFLMRPLLENGTTITEMIAQNSQGGGPIGILTSNAMWKLGWDISPTYLPGGAKAVGINDFGGGVGGGGKFQFVDMRMRKPDDDESSATTALRPGNTNNAIFAVLGMILYSIIKV